MRNTIFICTLLLLTACHNKNDLKRIDALEKENMNLNNKIFRFENIYDSLFYNFLDTLHPDRLTTCISFDQFIVTNKIVQRRIQLNKEAYKCQLIFAINESHKIDKFYYTFPSKTKTLKNDFIEIKNDNRFNFSPKDTGWYYWQGKAALKNHRTGEVRLYPIFDSFYVYK